MAPDYRIIHDPLEYGTVHPDTSLTPPLVTHDGHVSAVGTAHGRTIPVVGATRPPRMDVSFDKLTDDHTRIYADHADDVLAVMCGPEYQSRITRLRELRETFDNAVLDENSTVDVAALERESDKLNYALGLLRGNIAHQGRCLAQQAINDEARANGTWDSLTDEERSILERSTSVDNPAPVGILAQMQAQDDEGNLVDIIRGTWTADVALVVNNADYLPWARVAPIYSEARVPLPGGQVAVDNTSDLNVRRIRIDDADDLLQDLADLGVVDMTIRPVTPVDALHRGYYLENIDSRLAQAGK